MQNNQKKGKHANEICCICSKNLRKGFNQEELEEESKPKAGFVTPFGVYEPNRLLFGLANGPAFFSSIMQKILGHLPFIRVYIDDITIAY